MSSRIQQFTNSGGFTFSFRLVSPLLMAKIREANPPPEPPTQKVQNADGTFREEPNPDAPEYQGMLRRHNNKLSKIIQIRTIRLSVVPWQWTDEQRARIDEIREVMSGDIGEDETDIVVFIIYEVLAEVDDFQRFLQAATKGGPTDPKYLGGIDSMVSTSTTGQPENIEAVPENPA